MSLEFTDFVRKPFMVEVIEITTENMKEINDQFKLGELQKKDDDTPFIAIKKGKGSNTFRVYPGYFVTRMNEKNVRAYSRKIFFQQFGHMTDEWRAYFEAEKESV